jgi:hypothetical protein
MTQGKDQDHGASAAADRAFVPSASSPQAVSPVPASIPSADELRQLAGALQEACSIEGKPIGRHMIDGQRMIAKFFSQSEDDAARELSPVADCMAHCIENEALLFECLKTVAMHASVVLEIIASAIEARRAETEGLGAQHESAAPEGGDAQ